MAAICITENTKNMKQTISHEQPNGFCQIDAVILSVKAQSRCDVAFCGIHMAVLFVKNYSIKIFLVDGTAYLQILN